MNINYPTKILIGVLTAIVVLFPFLIAPGLGMLLMLGSFFPYLTPHLLHDPAAKPR